MTNPGLPSNALNQYVNVVTEIAATPTIMQGYHYDLDGNLAEGYIATDMDCSGEADYFDIDVFVLAVLDPEEYEEEYPNCDRMRGDVNGDGYVDFFDADRFVELLLSGAGGLRFVNAWDAENRLIEVRPLNPDGNSKKVNFDYDYMGRRVRKRVYGWNTGTSQWNTTPAADVKFVYDGWHLLLELDAANSNAIVRKYTWGLDLAGQNGSLNDRTSAGGIGGLLACNDPGASKNYYYFYDANGNVGQLIDASDGSLDAQYEYDPYGNIISQSGSYAAINPIRFSTKYWDDETGLGYWGYRYYSSRLGRWINPDPLGEIGGLNIYNYAKNRVANRIDPHGLKTYVIEGTWAGDNTTNGPCNAQFFGQDDPEGSFILTGPQGLLGGAFGKGVEWRVRSTVTEICKDTCSKSPPSQINIVGWSRGAVAALMVVDILEKEGCCCQWMTITSPASIASNGPMGTITRTTCCDERKPVINFLGLYDPVDMRPGNHPPLIPTNVRNCALAVGELSGSWCFWKSSHRQFMFPAAKCQPADWDKTNFRRRYFDADHGTIGCGSQADEWMRQCARNAGVKIPLVGPQHGPRMPPPPCWWR